MGYILSRGKNDLVFLVFLLIAILFSPVAFSKLSYGSSPSGLKCGCVVFRLTGVQDYYVNSAQTAIMKLFIDKNQSLTLGLVMNDIGRDQAIMDMMLEGKYKGLFEFAINGWNFTDYTRLSQPLQEDSLLQANKKMISLFEISTQIFIPPYETFDKTTIDAMRHAGMRVLSSNIIKDTNPFISNGEIVANVTGQTIYHLPATTSFSTYDVSGNTVKFPLQQLQDKIKIDIDKYGYAVINLDPQFFVNKIEVEHHVPKLNNQTLNDLSRLVEFLKSSNIDIMPFSKIIGLKTNLPLLQNEATLHKALQSDGTSNKVVILTFDDGFKSQYAIAKPILDMYGFKATFFVVCNFVGREIASRPYMDWEDIKLLQKEGHDIESHTMSHTNLSKVSKGLLDFEVGRSKQCLLDHGINSTIFAYPQHEGSDNITVVDVVSKNYKLARTGEEPLMYLHCDGWKGLSNQTDCRTYFDENTLTFVNRYSIPGWTHSSHSSTIYNSSQMLQKFINVINSQVDYNKYGIRAFPIIIYHDIRDQNITEYGTNTYSIDKDLFEAEMKYLYDNGFKVLTMANLAYDEHTNSFYLTDRRLSAPTNQ